VFDFKELNVRIIDVFVTQAAFADAMGLSEHTISKKLNNKVPWKQTEIVKAAALLDINAEDIPRYFFTPKVQ
jgi:transcriptional regulator with XRE-family HTH domain